MIKISKCKCGGKIENDEITDFEGSIGDGYLTEYHRGFCQKCKKEYIITITATIDLSNSIQVFVQQN